MNLLCPACHTPLPAVTGAIVSCPVCSAEVDVTRAGTVAGRPRFVPEIDRTGTTLDGYHIEARLGGGGMGTVYRARAGDGTSVAIKLLSPALAQSPALVSRFAREVSTLARLSHPAIVRVLAHGNEDGVPWFAMELVSGSDLRARLVRGPLSPAETAAIFARLFAALGHAHQAGVVHRDLKPGNVLLAAEGARLADFGIAHWDAEALTGTEALTRLTETAAVIGTLPYMSPEQRRGGAVDRRSDLFSAGVMLYEAATGSLPQGAFPPPSEVSSAYGARFDRLVLRLLQPDPSRRPASAAEAEAALALALAPRGSWALRTTAQAAVLLAVVAGAGFGGRAWLQRGSRATAASVSKSKSASMTATSEPLRRNELPRPAVDLPVAPFPPPADAGVVRAPEERLKVRAQVRTKLVNKKKSMPANDLDFGALSKKGSKQPPPTKQLPAGTSDLLPKAE